MILVAGDAPAATAAPADGRIVARGLSVWYGATRALADVSLAVPPRAVTAVIGPSGCGKSTLLRLVSGLVAPSGGALTINGMTPTEARRRRQFGIVFQSPVLFLEPDLDIINGVVGRYAHIVPCIVA